MVSATERYQNQLTNNNCEILRIRDNWSQPICNWGVQPQLSPPIAVKCHHSLPNKHATITETPTNLHTMFAVAKSPHSAFGREHSGMMPSCGDCYCLLSVESTTHLKRAISYSKSLVSHSKEKEKRWSGLSVVSNKVVFRKNQVVDPVVHPSRNSAK